MSQHEVTFRTRLLQRLSTLSIVEPPDERRLPRSTVERWLWMAALWFASVVALGVVGYALRLVLKT